MSGLSDVAKRMLQIKSLDSEANVSFSEYTHKWYVSARIEVGGDGLLRGISEHENTPEAAVDSYFHSLTLVDNDHYLVTSPASGRRHWKWNGAAFKEQMWTA